MTPKVEFEISKAVNEFCHFSVMYSDLMPPELGNGILGNRTYQERNNEARQDAVLLEVQRVKPFAVEADWYRFTTGLMRRSQSSGLRSFSNNNSFVELYQDLRERRAMGFDKIWQETRPRLEEYRSRFSGQWAPISDRVLSRLSELAKTPWGIERIHVHFVDCLYGGFGWNDCIGFTPFPDMEVQTKFLAHELSELITPHKLVIEQLRNAGMNPEITHTVVDMLAYFSVREFVTRTGTSSAEKKGVRPNSRYYLEVDKLLPVFEQYAENPSAYCDFGSFVKDMITVLGDPISSETPWELRVSCTAMQKPLPAKAES